MEPHLEKIRDVQKEAWNKSAPGWKKWDDMVMQFFKPAGDEMIRMMQLKNTDHVLDVASGTGEPGLTIAPFVSNGKVTATDLSENMLMVAQENAIKRNIDNFETVCCDVSDMPFENESMDAVCCRFGFMFFPDVELALREMIRVLKPGGQFAAAVWSVPDENFWISNSMETMIARLNLSPPSPQGPGMFRCAPAGMLKKLMQAAGLKEVTEKKVAGNLPCQTLENYWEFITEVACPVAFKNADEALQNIIKNEILLKAQKRYSSGKLEIDSSAIVVSGKK